MNQSKDASSVDTVSSAVPDSGVPRLIRKSIPDSSSESTNPTPSISEVENDKNCQVRDIETHQDLGEGIIYPFLVSLVITTESPEIWRHYQNHRKGLFASATYFIFFLKVLLNKKPKNYEL